MSQLAPSHSHRSRPRLRRESLALFVVLAVALILRLWGIAFGLPYEYHVDEVQYVRQAASMGAEGLEPVWWNNPPAYKYVLLGEYAALFGIGKLLGFYASVADFGSRLAYDPTVLYILARGTTALLGTLTVLVVYELGRVAYSRRTGLVAAWFLAVCFLHVRDSHYAVNDVPATLLVAIVLWTALMILESGEKRWYVVGGVALGLGFATKYSALVAVVPLVVAHLLSWDVRLKRPLHLQVRRFALVPLAAGVAAVMASPYFVLTPGKVVRGAYEALVLAGRYGFDGWEIDPAGGFVFYLKALGWGLGWGLLFLCVIGLAAAAMRRSSRDFVLLSLPVVMYVSLGSQQMYFARFILPAIPPLLVLAAKAAYDVAGCITRRIGRRWPTAVPLTVLVVLLATGQPLACSLFSDYLLTQKDTRTLAKEWIERHLHEGARVAVDWRTHGPPLSTLERASPGSDRRYDVLVLNGTGLADQTLAWYREQGFEYLIASSFIYRIRLLNKQRDAVRRALYASLDRELELVQEIRPTQGEREPPFIFDEVVGPAISLWERDRPGPTIKVYRVK